MISNNNIFTDNEGFKIPSSLKRFSLPSKLPLKHNPLINSSNPCNNKLTPETPAKQKQEIKLIKTPQLNISLNKTSVSRHDSFNSIGIVKNEKNDLTEDLREFSEMEKFKFITPELLLDVVTPESNLDLNFTPDFDLTPESNHVEYQILETVSLGENSKVYKILHNSQTFALKEIKLNGIKDRRVKLEEVVNLFRVINKNSKSKVEWFFSSVLCWEEKWKLYIMTLFYDFSLEDYLSQGRKDELCDKENINFTPEITPEITSKVILQITPELSRDEFIKRKDFLRQIVLAVKWLHEINILHLDIKPSNILLDFNSNKIIITDFGSSMYVKEDSKIKHNPSQSISTWYINDIIKEGDSQYISQETLNGVKCRESDYFSVGLVGLRLVSDVILPFNGEFYYDLRHLISLKSVLEKYGFTVYCVGDGENRREKDDIGLFVTVLEVMLREDWWERSICDDF